MSIVKIENVRVLDPIQKTDLVKTVFIENGKLVEAAEPASGAAETVHRPERRRPPAGAPGPGAG